MTGCLCSELAGGSCPSQCVIPTQLGVLDRHTMKQIHNTYSKLIDLRQRGSVMESKMGACRGGETEEPRLYE